jgi:hypothetical protein
MIVALVLAAIVLVLLLWLAFGRGPRRRRAFARAGRLLEAGNWMEALTITEGLRASRGLSEQWQARLRNLAGECHQRAAEEALKDKRYEDAAEHRSRVVEAKLAEARRLFDAGTRPAFTARNCPATAEWRVEAFRTDYAGVSDARVGDPATAEQRVKAFRELVEGEEEPLRRYTDVSFPARVRVGKTYPLRVQIVPAEETLPTGEVRPLPRPHAHDASLALTATLPVRVTVSVAAENFEVDGPARLEVVVPLAGKSAPVSLDLRGQTVGPGRIMVDFSQDGLPVGSVDLYPQVQPQHEEETDDPAHGKGEVHIACGPADPPPDVVLKVFEQRQFGGAGRLHFVLSSADPRLQDLPVLDGDLGTQDLHASVVAWVEERFHALGHLAAQAARTGAEVQRALCDVGHQLFEELLPEKLRSLYWTLRQRGARSVLVLSDEPHIPWELIKPFRADPISGALEKEDGFWGEVFALTHWLRGRPPTRRLGLERVFAVAASGTVGPGDSRVRDMTVLDCESSAPTTPAPAPLSAVAEEIALLRSLQSAGAYFVRLLPARRHALRETLEQGGFDVLHLACHGTFGAVGSADGAAVFLEDGPFSAAELSPRMAGPIRQAAPLIFFNACHSGRLGLSLTGLGSWGARLVQMGCGGFIGALWPVTDRAALAFARAFYEGLTRGLPIGEAVAAARQAVHQRYPDDPTWLAYRCFADPGARLEGRLVATEHRPA